MKSQWVAMGRRGVGKRNTNPKVIYGSDISLLWPERCSGRDRHVWVDPMRLEVHNRRHAGPGS